MRGGAENGGSPFGLRRWNLLLLVAGAVSVVAGYVQLHRGSVNSGPLLLVLGYFLFLPAGLLAGWRRGRTADGKGAQAARTEGE
ncbi:MAG: hypothetical protein RRA92_04065 [Gemmatimonadota bacterium]|nr:hypothetical protein [Gemmatimonadota bacterium]